MKFLQRKSHSCKMPAIKLALQFKLLNWNNLKNEEIVNWNNDFQDTNEQLNSFINKFVIKTKTF